RLGPSHHRRPVHPPQAAARGTVPAGLTRTGAAPRRYEDLTVTSAARTKAIRWPYWIWWYRSSPRTTRCEASSKVTAYRYSPGTWPAVTYSWPFGSRYGRGATCCTGTS